MAFDDSAVWTSLAKLCGRQKTKQQSASMKYRHFKKEALRYTTPTESKSLILLFVYSVLCLEYQNSFGTGAGTLLLELLGPLN